MCYPQSSVAVSAAFFVLSMASAKAGASFPSHVVDPIFAGASSVTAVDLDNDGKIDLAAAGYYEDTISWWRNLGANQWERFDILTLNCPFSIRAADLDHDGDMDLYGSSLCASTIWGEDSVGWIENRLEIAGTEPPQFVPHKIFDFPNQDPQSLDAADFDGDGNLDIAVAFLMEPVIYLFLNPDGTGREFPDAIVTLPVPNVNGVSFVRGDDFDDDGDTDIVAATAWDWVGVSNYYWFRNDDGAFTGPIPIVGGPEYNGAFVAGIGDIDGDGMKDLVTSGDASAYGDPTVRWVRRLNPQGTLWADGIVVDNHFGGGNGDQSIHVVDLDGDSDLDIVGGAYLFDPRVRAWLNLGAGRFRKIDVEQGFGTHAVTTADTNGDGKLEIVAADWGECCYSGAIKYWALHLP